MSTTFDEGQHPRAAGGQFTTKNHSEADIDLGADTAPMTLSAERLEALEDGQALNQEDLKIIQRVIDAGPPGTYDFTYVEYDDHL